MTTRCPRNSHLPLSRFRDGQHKVIASTTRNPGFPTSVMHVVDSRSAAPDNGRDAGQWAGGQVGECGFDDRVAGVGEVGVGDRFGGVGEERVISPYWEQSIGLIGVFD